MALVYQHLSQHLDAKVPEDSDMRGQFGPRTKDTVDKANEVVR
jgi:glycine amidinotransferase